MDSQTTPRLAEMQNRDGSLNVCDRVWISSIGCAEQEHTGKLAAGFGAAAGGPKISYELAGFVWFQGWNDMVESGTCPNCDTPGGYDA